jgi:hypothetical protein
MDCCSSNSYLGVNWIMEHIFSSCGFSMKKITQPGVGLYGENAG